MTQKIEPFKLQQLFIDSMSNSPSFDFIDGLNPFRIRLNEVELYIYIKNISSAYFSNPDISRVQLPIRDDFDKIKATELDFVLLGYDAENDVYATWNPKWAKQRLNIAESVSFYSRFSLQKEAAKGEDIKRMQLNNDGEVIVFPRTYIEFILTNLKRFFKDDSDYVAIGSKKRPVANESYKMFTDSKNIKKMESYMYKNGYSHSAVCNYSRCMKVLFEENLISRYRKMFLVYNTIDEYLSVVSTFCSQPIVKELNEKTHNAYSASLKMYIKALIADEELEYPTTLQSSQDLYLTKQDAEPVGNDSFVDVNVVDWETSYTDESGKLIALKNPELIEKLKPILDTEYRSLPAALNILSDFYGDRFPNMQFSDWVKLLNAINWDSPYDVISIQGKTNSDVKSKSKTVNLRVKYPDGRIIQHPKATDTYATVIENHNPAIISSLNIIHAGINIVQKELDEKYGSAQREISNGWYVFTNTSTPTKGNDLKIISDKLNLNLEVDLISIETGEIVSVEKRSTSDKRKIRVTFPDGRTIQPNKVLEALVEVVKYAGPVKVRNLNIICCGDNLILKNPAPRYINPSKPVGDGWLCNTCSDTPTKYEQILHISKSLNLDLHVEIL